MYDVELARHFFVFPISFLDFPLFLFALCLPLVLVFGFGFWDRADRAVLFGCFFFIFFPSSFFLSSPLFYYDKL